MSNNIIFKYNGIKRGMLLTLFLMILFFSSFNVIKAAEKIASCVYYPDKVINDNAPSKLIIDVYDDYTIDFNHFDYQKITTTCTDVNGNTSKLSSLHFDWEQIEAIDTQNDVYILEKSNYCEVPDDGQDQLTDIIYKNFVKNNRFECENVSKIYYENNNSTRYHAFFKDQTLLEEKFYYSFVTTGSIYNLDTKESRVFVSNQAKVDKEEGWTEICHYGPTVLKINKNEQKLLLIDNNLKNNQNEDQELFDLIKENSYSCPYALCHNLSGKSYFTYEANCKERNVIIYPETYTDNQYTCGIINTYMQNIVNYHSEYLETKSIQARQEIKKSETYLKDFCKTVLKNSDYNHSTKCVEECVNISEDINEVLGESVDYGQCGFSGKLIIFIANIVKWGKYLIPVIVIVLSILDFIKAISSEKEDEMKKAQGNFVKRLIIAGLIFIIPFIIEFVLDKMGFGKYISGCGIIDL